MEPEDITPAILDSTISMLKEIHDEMSSARHLTKEEIEIYSALVGDLANNLKTAAYFAP